jgi:hypothetical protein
MTEDQFLARFRGRGRDPPGDGASRIPALLFCALPSGPRATRQRFGEPGRRAVHHLDFLSLKNRAMPSLPSWRKANYVPVGNIGVRVKG